MAIEQLDDFRVITEGKHRSGFNEEIAGGLQASHMSFAEAEDIKSCGCFDDRFCTHESTQAALETDNPSAAAIMRVPGGIFGLVILPVAARKLTEKNGGAAVKAMYDGPRAYISETIARFRNIGIKLLGHEGCAFESSKEAHGTKESHMGSIADGRFKQVMGGAATHSLFTVDHAVKSAREYVYGGANAATVIPERPRAKLVGQHSAIEDAVSLEDFTGHLRLATEDESPEGERRLKVYSNSNYAVTAAIMCAFHDWKLNPAAIMGANVALSGDTAFKLTRPGRHTPLDMLTVVRGKPADAIEQALRIVE